MTTLLLPLDRWASLDDAYGTATPVHGLLTQLLDWAQARTDRGLAWPETLGTDLWSRLCHQNTVYTASYAAFPVLVEAIARCGAVVPPDLLELVVCLDHSRRDGLNGPRVPNDLGKPYVKALVRLPTLMAPVLLHAPDERLVRAALAANAAAAGYSDLAMAMLELDADRVARLLHEPA